MTIILYCAHVRNTKNDVNRQGGLLRHGDAEIQMENAVLGLKAHEAAVFLDHIADRAHPAAMAGGGVF